MWFCNVRFFVTPSDSVAIIAANVVQSIPYFSSGLKGRYDSVSFPGCYGYVTWNFNICWPCSCSQRPLELAAGSIKSGSMVVNPMSWWTSDQRTTSGLPHSLIPSAFPCPVWKRNCQRLILRWKGSTRVAVHMHHCMWSAGGEMILKEPLSSCRKMDSPWPKILSGDSNPSLKKLMPNSLYTKVYLWNQ